jgi:UDP-N-acetylglucosamine acyltransferase
MSHAPTAKIHPTAIVAPEAELADHVEVGPFALIEGRVKIGPECVIRPGAYLYGPLTMGRGNVVHTGAVLGDRPQHLRYNNEPTSVEIGDGNTFREHVTVHRGTTQSMVTRIGNNNLFMVHSHIAHDCVVGDRCIFTNGCMLGGHCIVADQVIMSGNSALHQFVRIGRLAMISGCSASTKDVPPFILQQNIDNVVGVNLVGMRRAGMSHGQIDGVKRAFNILFRQGLPLPAATAKLQRELGDIDAVQEMLEFLRGCSKGICQMRQRTWDEAA